MMSKIGLILIYKNKKGPQKCDPFNLMDFSD